MIAETTNYITSAYNLLDIPLFHYNIDKKQRATRKVARKP